MGIVEDKLQYRRWESQIRFMQRAEQVSKDVGFTSFRPVPLKFMVPLLEAVSLEDDEQLQELWVRLLVNAINGENHFTIRRAHIAILEQLTAFKATLLQKIYALPYAETQDSGVIAARLPLEATVWTDETKDADLPEPSDEVKLALSETSPDSVA